MNDDEARRVLADIDGPRPLPPRLRDDLTSAMAVAATLSEGASSRPVPDDVRLRIEASLLAAPQRPVPRRLRRRLVAGLARPRPRLVGIAAAAALVAAVVGVAAIPQEEDDRPMAARPPAASSATTTSVAAGSASGAATEPAAGDAASGTADAGAAAPSAGQRSDAAPAGSATGVIAPVEVRIVGDPSSDAGAGFEAYLRVANASGGVRGRSVVSTTRGRGVATVNLEPGTAPESVAGVVFEAGAVAAGALRSGVVSLASPVEVQAQLAVERAFPDPALGRRAVVYVSDGRPWSAAADAFESALRRKDVTVVRVPDPGTYVAGVDAAFLALSATDAARWIAGGSVAPPLGAWAIGSAYDDRLASAAAQRSVRVLSPYAPMAGDEAAALVAAMPDGALTAGRIHGWATAKAVFELLRRNGGAVITDAELDALRGWEVGWSPPFDRARRDAVVLEPSDGRFVARGRFERAPSGSPST